MGFGWGGLVGGWGGSLGGCGGIMRERWRLIIIFMCQGDCWGRAKNNLVLGVFCWGFGLYDLFVGTATKFFTVKLTIKTTNRVCYKAKIFYAFGAESGVPLIDFTNFRSFL